VGASASFVGFAEIRPFLIRLAQCLAQTGQLRGGLDGEPAAFLNGHVPGEDAAVVNDLGGEA
jgi:hypothetical protein